MYTHTPIHNTNVYILFLSLSLPIYILHLLCVICRYATKEAATHAIVALHNTEINQQLVKCAWGKESGEPLHMAALASQALGHGFPFGTAAAAAAAAAYGQHVTGYWYPSAPTAYQTAAATAAAAAAAPTAPTAANALQPGQYLQGMQGFTTFGQFGGYQQGFMG